MAYALGSLRGAADPAGNDALSAYTDLGNNTPVDPGAGKVQFQTVQPVDLPSGTGKHHILFGADAGSVNCPNHSPRLQFNLLNGSAVTPVGGPINTCTDPRGGFTTVPSPAGGTLGVYTGTYTTSEALPFTGSSLDLQMINDEGSGKGNDSAVDNISLMDATPTVSKSFSPSPVAVGGTSTLTFTVDVTSDTAGTYQNCASDTSNLNGVNPPGSTVAYTLTLNNPGSVPAPASIDDDLSKVLDDAASSSGAAPDYTSPHLTMKKSSDVSTALPGQQVTYTVTITNDGKGDVKLTNAVVGPPDSNCPAGSTDPRCATHHHVTSPPTPTPTPTPKPPGPTPAPPHGHGGGHLPDTGVQGWTIAALAALAVATGFTLRTLTRRRRAG
jgi:LPXTG-motif cell wall-anchored protein